MGSFGKAPELTHKQQQDVDWIIIFCSSCSALACFLVLWLLMSANFDTVFFSHLRLLYLCDLFVVLGLLSKYLTSSCTASAFLLQFGSQCSLLFTWLLVKAVYDMGFASREESATCCFPLHAPRTFTRVKLACVATSLSIALIPLFTGHYGDTQGWCWIDDDTQVWSAVFRAIFYFGQLWAVFFHMVFMIWRLWWHGDSEKYDEIWRLVGMYPCVLCLLVIVGTVNRTVQWPFGETYFAPVVLNAALLSLYPCVNVLVFFCSGPASEHLFGENLTTWIFSVQRSPTYVWNFSTDYDDATDCGSVISGVDVKVASDASEAQMTRAEEPELLKMKLEWAPLGPYKKNTSAPRITVERVEEAKEEDRLCTAEMVGLYVSSYLSAEASSQKSLKTIASEDMETYIQEVDSIRAEVSLYARTSYLECPELPFPEELPRRGPQNSWDSESSEDESLELDARLAAKLDKISDSEVQEMQTALATYEEEFEDREMEEMRKALERQRRENENRPTSEKSTLFAKISGFLWRKTSSPSLQHFDLYEAHDNEIPEVPETAIISRAEATCQICIFQYRTHESYA